MDFHAVSVFTPPVPNAYAVVAGVSPAFPNMAVDTHSTPLRAWDWAEKQGTVH
jgi:hypothetical protein